MVSIISESTFLYYDTDKLCKAFMYSFVNFSFYLLGRGIDYGYTTPQVYTFTFPAGTTCASSDISIPITDDMISENDETFNIVIIEISLPFGVKLGSVNKATVRILDNDSK